jgi:hypothetical protein
MPNGFKLLMSTPSSDDINRWFNVVDEADDIEDLVDVVTSRTILIKHLGYDIIIPEVKFEALKILDRRTGRIAGYLMCEPL